MNDIILLLGCVVKTYAGKNRMIRIVDVKRGILKRSISKLGILLTEIKS